MQLKLSKEQHQTIRVEIAGGIATGKTELARALAKIEPWTDAGVILEDYRSNPFWNKFLGNKKVYHFPKTLTFILQHGASIHNLINSKKTICDFSLFQDLAYADLLATNNEHELCKAVYNYYRTILPGPTTIIHLECNMETQMNRIKNRKREEEKLIQADYLSRLNQIIHDKIFEFGLNNIVSRFDTDEIDFVANPNFIDDINQEIIETIAGYEINL